MRISVAVKLVIFFGLSIMVVVIAALAVPWAWMQSLADEMAVQSARHAAQIAAARVGVPDPGDWEQKQELLEKWWPQFVRQAEGLPVEAPRLLAAEAASRASLDDGDDFPGEAVEYLRSHPEKRELARAGDEEGPGVPLRDGHPRRPHTARGS